MFDRGQIGCGVEESAVTLADDGRLVRQGGDVAEEKAKRALADLGQSGGGQFLAEGSEGGVVKTLP